MTKKTVIRAILLLLFGGFVLGFAFGGQGPAGHIGKNQDQLTVAPERTVPRLHRPRFVHPHLHLYGPWHHSKKTA